jgi:internalin A
MKHIFRSQVWLAPLSAGLFQGVLSLAVVTASTALSGCDEKEEPLATPETATKSAQPESAPPPPPPAPEPAAEPPKERKKFEDCDQTKIEISNADLEAAIRLKAQKPEGEIGVSDLKKLRSLNLSRVDLPELDVCIFHHMSELRELFLGPSGIDDISAISGSTKMETLGLARNPIEDLSPIAEMTKLDRLDLAKTKVKDISALAKLTSLTELTLDGTEVEDLGPLSGMTKLERLSLNSSKVRDLKPVTDFKSLKFLYIADSDVDLGQTGSLAQNGTKVILD